MEVVKTSNKDLNRKSVSEFRQSSSNNVTIVLDNIRSLQNVGSFFRTADAFQISKIYLCGITGVPPNRDIEKTALGSTESVKYEYFENTSSCVKKLISEGFIVSSVEQVNSSISLEKFAPETQNKYAFVFGNEVFGVSDEVVNLSNLCIEIPQFGTKHSLNVSVCAGIILWHYQLNTSLNLFSKPS